LYVDYAAVNMHKEKVLGYSGILKGGMLTIPKGVREKLSVKEGNILTCLEGRNGYVKIEIGI
jgi:hypothetical protein